ncbi:hypothetical protein E4U15_001164 [Claviceps sp. LM218 group G6]|nr:hypothetical protein E4U15_001164 [Claviceps sp. LM218 group G6]
MPTPTQYFGYLVTNVGPLTTHFTPAASCATAKPNVYIVTQLADTRGLFGFPSCEAPKYDGCLPQGESLDRLNRDLATHPRNGNLAYHSPGLQCPSGWKKAGRVVGADTQATKPRGGLSFKGINMSTVMQNGNPGPLPKLHAYASILDPGETLVWCCPKGFTANADATCTSDLGPFSSFSYTRRCEIYLPSQDLLTITSHQGTLLPNPLVVITPAVSDMSSSTFTIAPAETPSLTVVSAVPVVALIHKSSDKKGTGHASPPTVDDDEDDSASRALRPSLMGVVLGMTLLSAQLAATTQSAHASQISQNFTLHPTLRET